MVRPGALAFVDIDSMRKRVYGHKKQAQVRAHNDPKKSLLARRLNAMVATVSTPPAAPVITENRLRRGNAASACGVAFLAAAATGTARQ